MSEKVQFAGMLIPRGDAHDIDFAEYHFPEVGELNEKVHSEMRTRRYTVGDTDVPYRVANHWEDKNILPDGFKSDGGWRKFTIVEIAWLQAVLRMREYGLSLQKVARVKKVVMEWHAKDKTYPLFEYFFVKACVSKTDPYIAILNDGRATVASSAQIELHKLLCGTTDLLLISLKSIAREMKLPFGKAEHLFSLANGEEEILQGVRLGKNKEIKARVKDGEVTEIETTEAHTESSMAKIDKSLKEDGAFAEVITKYADGVRQSAEVRRRKRLKR